MPYVLSMTTTTNETLTAAARSLRHMEQTLKQQIDVANDLVQARLPYAMHTRHSLHAALVECRKAQQALESRTGWIENDR